VERALHAVADDRAAVADVGPEVPAVGFEDVELTVLVAPGHEVLAEVLEGPDLAGGELRRPADLPPPGHLPGERNLHRTPWSTHGRAIHLDLSYRRGRMSLRSMAFGVQDEPGEPDDPIVSAPLLGRLLEEI